MHSIECAKLKTKPKADADATHLLIGLLGACAAGNKKHFAMLKNITFT